MKLQKKYYSVRNINTVDDKLIKHFYEEIKEHYHDYQILSNLMKSQKSSEIIQSILSKNQKSETEIFIVNTFLKQLSNFMSIINQKNDEKKIEAILTKISTELTMEIYPKNSFLMKVGEIGKHFYVTLSGKVSIIVPKPLIKRMSKEQYMNHLKFLYNNNERHLLEKTYILNQSIYKFDIKEIEIKDENLIIETPLKISIQDYISKINADDIINDIDNQVKIIGYFNVVDLIQGSSFGEIALINKNNQRTATIIVKEDSVFGVLSAQEYKFTMKKIQQKIKRENIEFIFSTKIFNSLGMKIFTTNYWNYFINEKLKKGQYLFKFDEIRDKIYFIYDGEIKLITPNLTQKKTNLLIEKFTNISFKNENDDGKGEDIILSFSKKGDILGLEDILFNGKFICNAICVSDNLSYFSIDINILNEIKENYSDVEDEILKFEKKKITLVLNRLNVIKQYYESSLIHKNNKEEIKLDKIKVKSFFDTKGEEIIMKENEIPKRKSQILIQPFIFINENNQINKKHEPSRNSISHLPSIITSNLTIKYDFLTGEFNEKKKKTKDNNSSYSSSIENTESDSENSNDLINKDNNNNNKSINNNNHNTLILPSINSNNNNNTINNNNNISIQKKRNSIKNLKYMMNIPKTKITHLIKFTPIKREMISLVKTEEENKIIENKIKDSISFTEPKDNITKEYVEKIIKKNDQISNALSFDNGRIKSTKYNDIEVFKLRLFDNAFERFITNEKDYVNNKFNEVGFNSKQIPPNFMIKRKKIKNLKLKLKKIHK